MTMQSIFIPTDMASLWDMNRKSLGDTEAAIRAWFEMSNQAQEQATKFMSSRWAKDAVALAQLGRCKTPVDALNVQMTYLTGACVDYMNEGRKIVSFFGDVVRETLPGMAAEHGPSTSGKSMSGRSKHSAHRVTSH